MICEVKGLCVGDERTVDGVRCVVESFPTRSSVVLKAVQPRSGQWSRAKLSVRRVVSV